MPAADLKPVRWIAASLHDLKQFPEPVQRAVGYSLFRAQQGLKAPNAKPLKGIVKGAGVLEIVADHETDAYRLVYTIRFADVVYVIHAFQKKSRRGGQTPRHDVDLIRSRYELALIDHERRREVHGR